MAIATRDPSATQLRSLTGEEMAKWRRERGARLVRHQGHFWEMVKWGFYQPIHELARLRADEATRPTSLCWGYRAVLREEDGAAANAAYRVRMANNLPGYDMASLPSKRRNSLRVCQRRVEIVEVLDPRFLEEGDAYSAYVSALKRTGGEWAVSHALLRRDEFAVHIEKEVRPDLGIVLAGRIGRKVGGYLTAHAVDGTAYINSVILATEALPTNIGTGLVFEFMQTCRRSERIREVCYGPDTPGDVPLSRFKEGMGFSVVSFRARVGMPPGMKSLIRWRRPGAYYRLFGK